MKIFNTLYGKLSAELFLLLFVLAGLQIYRLSILWSVVSDGSLQQVNLGIAQEIAKRLEPYLADSADYWSLQRAAHDLTSINPGIAIYIIGRDGRLISDLSEGAPAVTKQIPVAPIEQFLRGGDIDFPLYGSDPRSLGAKGQTVFSAATIKSGESAPYLYVALKSDRRSVLGLVLDQQLILRKMIFDVLYTIGAAGLIGLVLFFFLTKKLTELQRTVRAYKKGDFSTRAAISSNDEIGQLAETVNQMADTIVENMSELQKRDRMRRELVGNVSHDLRRPVTIITTYTEMLQEKLANLSKSEIQTHCHTLNRSAHSLAKLLAQLFELSKLEAKELAPEVVPFSLEELAETTVLRFQPRADELGVGLSSRADGDVPLVAGDILMIERVLDNLVENALRYTNNGGSVSIVMERADGFVKISVCDTGLGISKEKVARVFERSYQAEPEKGGDSSHAGLGLAIVRRILEAHGSGIAVESREGEGSTFVFNLAIAEISRRSVA